MQDDWGRGQVNSSPRWVTIQVSEGLEVTVCLEGNGSENILRQTTFQRLFSYFTYLYLFYLSNLYLFISLFFFFAFP